MHTFIIIYHNFVFTNRIIYHNFIFTNGIALDFRDFDSLLYLCEGAFNYLPLDTFARLTEGVVFPCYVVAMAASLALMAASVFAKWRYARSYFHYTFQSFELSLICRTLCESS